MGVTVGRDFNIVHTLNYSTLGPPQRQKLSRFGLVAGSLATVAATAISAFVGIRFTSQSVVPTLVRVAHASLQDQQLTDEFPWLVHRPHSKGSELDIILGNYGSDTAVITGALVTVFRAGTAVCLTRIPTLPGAGGLKKPRGGGATPVEAKYDVPIPLSVPSANSVERDMRFEVPPKSIERFVLGILPAPDRSPYDLTAQVDLEVFGSPDLIPVGAVNVKGQ
ncbi:hypothetical protein ACIRRA_42985 [Nocardia sp. NPDC101769]|uniref:hypothetical protein n=1 Tax=Nocardia sp. NPDC101769 TaxID=3364333 RepID=UPI00380187A9